MARALLVLHLALVQSAFIQGLPEYPFSQWSFVEIDQNTPWVNPKYPSLSAHPSSLQ